MALSKAQESLLGDLQAFAAVEDWEHVHRQRMIEFASACENPFNRDHPWKHFTCSALIVTPEGDKVLLIRHKKLNRWLQPGGHGEPQDSRGLDVAVREASEETGVPAEAFTPLVPGIVGLDIHLFPKRGGQLPHEHFDLRYALVCTRPELVSVNRDEGEELKWFEWHEIESLGLPAPVLREALKVKELAARKIGR